MSLEKELAANTAAVEKLTAVLEVAFATKDAAPAKPKKAEKTKPAKEKEPEEPAKEKEPEEPAKEKEPEEPADDGEEDESMFGGDDEEVTLKDLQTALKEMVAKTSKDDAKALLKKFGVAKLPDLEEEKFGELLAAINKQLKK